MSATLGSEDESGELDSGELDSGELESGELESGELESGELVERVLGTAQARLRLLARLRVVGPFALATALLVQLALLPGAHGVPCGLLALAAVAIGASQAVKVAGPGRSFVGAYLDARLGSGAVLASAAEALEGAHPRFGSALLTEAAEQLSSRASGPLVPWRFSPFWALALTATALSPLSLRAAPPPPGPRLVSRSLLDPSLLAPGPGGGGSEEPSSPSSSSGEEGRYGLNEAAEGAEAPTTPLELPLDVAAALARAISGSGAGGGGEGGAEPSLPDPLWKTAQTSGLEEALREVAELKAAAQSGDRAARARLDQLGRALAQAQGGGGGVGAPPQGDVPQPSPQATPPSVASRAGTARLPARLAGALDRYFSP